MDKIIVTVETLKALAKQGITKSEAGRALAVSRQRISEFSLQHNIKFDKRRSTKVEIRCEECKSKRLVSRGEAKRKKTPYCTHCCSVKMGFHLKAAAASPVNKKRSP